MKWKYWHTRPVGGNRQPLRISLYNLSHLFPFGHKGLQIGAAGFHELTDALSFFHALEVGQFHLVAGDLLLERRNAILDGLMSIFHVLKFDRIQASAVDRGFGCRGRSGRRRRNHHRPQRYLAGQRIGIGVLAPDVRWFLVQLLLFLRQQDVIVHVDTQKD